MTLEGQADGNGSPSLCQTDHPEAKPLTNQNKFNERGYRHTDGGEKESGSRERGNADDLAAIPLPFGRSS